MSQKQKKMVMRILISAALFVAASIILPSDKDNFVRLLCFLVPYFMIGYDVLYKAVRNILHGQIFDENFLMCIATVGALCIGEYPEAVAVMLFYQVGELFQGYAVNRSRKSIAQLMDIRPDYANIEDENGELIQVDPEELEIGQKIVVKSGERIPLDGIIEQGRSMVDTSALTGESVPRSVKEGESVLSGCINGQGLLYIRVTKEFGESTVSKILDLVENASSKKAKAENFITKFARYYTPCVVFAAIALAMVPPILLGGDFVQWLQRALTFLVISCPCALVISVPLSFFGGIGAASKCGILVKGGNYLEALSKADTVVFDKTGTLTKGVFRVTGIYPQNAVTKEQLLEIAAQAESYSDHPISLSLQEAYGKTVDKSQIKEVEEIAGHGVKAEINGKVVFAGNEKLMKKANIKLDALQESGTVVHIAQDGAYLGRLLISDEIKEYAADAIKALKKIGVRQTVMLTGDRTQVAKQVAQQVGVDEVYAQLLPAQKVEIVEKLLNEQPKDAQLLFVGDGINDAPVLSRADVGIAMGAIGSDAAIEAADIVLMDDNPKKIVTAIQIARKTLFIVKENIIFALAIKAIVLLLGAVGMANMWGAVFADVGVSVIAILNATRTLYMGGHLKNQDAPASMKPEKAGN